MRLEKYVVTLERPSGVTKTEMKAYIEEAVSAWNGSFRPEDPLFDLDRDSVHVTSLRATDERKSASRAQKTTYSAQLVTVPTNPRGMTSIIKYE